MHEIIYLFPPSLCASCKEKAPEGTRQHTPQETPSVNPSNRQIEFRQLVRQRNLIGAVVHPSSGQSSAR